MATYTVASDFHQNAKALQYIFNNYENTQIVLLGDLFDTHGDSRMNDAKTMAETLINCYNHAPIKPLLIRGDHDDFIIGASENNSKTVKTWLYNNGRKTLRQLGYSDNEFKVNLISDFLNANYPELIKILKQSKLIINKPNILFVHGGLNWSKAHPITETTPQDAMWLREKYIYARWYYLLHDYTNLSFLFNHPSPHRNTIGKTIVSGHTPTYLVDLASDGNIVTLHHKHDPKNINRYLIDGGSGHSFKIAHLNIAQFNDKGKLISQESYTY